MDDFEIEYTIRRETCADEILEKSRLSLLQAAQNKYI